MSRALRSNHVGERLLIIRPHLKLELLAYAYSMTFSENSVLIRSTMGVSEPRYQHATKCLERIGFKTEHINWARSGSNEQEFKNVNQYLFCLNAPYGMGTVNYTSHLRFNLYIYRTLRSIRPKVIYACDLDTLLACFMYSYFHSVILIFDQFDPLSARVRNRFVRGASDILEATIARKADIRVTANIQRIPAPFRHTWIEIKNLFPIEFTRVNQQIKQDVFQLVYGGILSNDRGLVESVNFVKTRKLWRFDVFGQGPARGKLKEVAGENVVIHDQVSHNELMDFAQSADLYLALYDPSSQNNRLTASNKLFEAAQLGVPLLTTKGTHIGEIVQKFKLGWAVTYGDSEEFKAALEEYVCMTETQRIGLIDNLTHFFQDEIKVQSSNIQILENRTISMIKLNGK